MLPGCRGDRSNKPPRQFFPDMDDQPKWKPQAGSQFFVDGRTMRPRVPGTVAFARAEFDVARYGEASWADPFMGARADLLGEDRAHYTGMDAQGNFLDYIPPSVTVDLALLRQGQELFYTYCAPCHGYLGHGDGMVGRQWSIAVANFTNPIYLDRAQRTGKDGYIFHTIRNGKGEGDQQTMPGYAHALSADETWAIVAYVRALQQAEQGTFEDVPEPLRSQLREERQKVLRERASELNTGEGKTTGGGA